jgi:hypothetical protein
MDIGHVRWRKASYSNANGGNCVEVVSAPVAVTVRDSRHPEGPRLAFTPAEWRAFTRRVKKETLGSG